MSKTRQSSTRLFDLTPIEQFSGVNLPTNGEVLRRFFSIKDNSEINNLKNNEISKQIYDELQGLYNKIPITMKAKNFGARKICDLYEKWRSINRHKKSCSKLKKEKFQSELNNICDLVGKFYEHEILSNRLLTQKQKEEDLKFIQVQRTDRISKFSTNDRVYFEKSCAKAARDIKTSTSKSLPKMSPKKVSPKILTHKRESKKVQSFETQSDVSNSDN